MDNVQVRVNGIQIDIKDAVSAGIATTYSARTVDTLNAFRTTKAKTIKVPLTRKNNQTLGFTTAIDGTVGIDQKAEWFVEIVEHGEVTLSGLMRWVRTVVSDGEDYGQFTIQPSERGWLSDMQGVNLRATNWQNQEHTLTASVIATTNNLSSVAYAYPPIDTGIVNRIPVYGIWVVHLSSDGDDADGNPIHRTRFVLPMGTYHQASTYRLEGFQQDIMNGQVLYLQFETLNGVQVLMTKNIAWTFSDPATGSDTSEVDDYGFGYGGGYLVPVTIDQPRLRVSDFLPAIKFSEILKRSFDEIDYTLKAPELMTEIADKYSYYGGTREGDFEADLFRVGLTGDIVDVTNGGVSLPLLTLSNITETGFVPNTTAWNPATNTYTVQAESVQRFTFRYGFEYFMDDMSSISFLESWTPYGIVRPQIEVVRASGQVNAIQTFNGIAGKEFLYWAQFSPMVAWAETGQPYPSYVLQKKLTTRYVHLYPGDQVRVIVSATTASDTFTGDDRQSRDHITRWVKSATSFSNEISTDMHIGELVKLNQYLPNKTAFDFVRELAFMYNLKFFTDELNKEVVMYFDGSGAGQVDWSEKVNQGKPVKMEDFSQFHPKSYGLRYADDSGDAALEKYKEDNGTDYAGADIANPNIFKTDSKEIRLGIYAPTWEDGTGFVFGTDLIGAQAELDGEDLIVPVIKDDDGERFEFEPRVFRIYQADMPDVIPAGGGTATPATMYVEGVQLTNWARAVFHDELPFEKLKAEYYTRFEQALQTGRVIECYVDLSAVDVYKTFKTLDENGEDFRAEFELSIGANKVVCELVDAQDYNPSKSTLTKCRFLAKF